MATRKKKVLTAFNESVAAADWIDEKHSALILVGRRLAGAIDEVDDGESGAYSKLSRLSLELRNVLRQLGLTVGDEPAKTAVVVPINPLERIRASS